MKIGIDIGGTNTDLVLVDKNKKIIGQHKEPTTSSIELAVVQGLSQLLQKEEVLPQAIEGVFIGTTHATNAILQGRDKDLLQVGLIRIAGNHPDISPGAAWPTELRRKIISASETIPGGYECHGEPITPFDETRAEQAIDRLLTKGVEAIAVVGVFSPMNRDQEIQVLQLIKKMAGPMFPVTLSSDIGGIGFLERENATLLNSALKKVVGRGFEALEMAVKGMGVQAPLYMIHNDGSVMDMQRAIDFPIFTISAGQTNSFRGAISLANRENAIIIDVGGTSSDIGLVTNGYPKRSCKAAKIGGVKLQFPMPDVLSLAIGGGSIVCGEKIGPESVARELLSQAQCFHGNVLTLTDVGVLTGHLEIAGAQCKNISLTKPQAKALLHSVHMQMEQAIAIVKGKNSSLPVIAVGGGAALLENVLQIPFGNVANAYGATLAEISSTIDIVTSLHKRLEVLEEVRAKAITSAIEKGALPTDVRVVNVEIIPYAYSKEALARVIVTAAGKGS